MHVYFYHRLSSFCFTFSFVTYTYLHLFKFIFIVNPITNVPHPPPPFVPLHSAPTTPQAVTVSCLWAQTMSHYMLSLLLIQHLALGISLQMLAKESHSANLFGFGTQHIIILRKQKQICCPGHWCLFKTCVHSWAPVSAGHSAGWLGRGLGMYSDSTRGWDTHRGWLIVLHTLEGLRWKAAPPCYSTEALFSL